VVVLLPLSPQLLLLVFVKEEGGLGKASKALKFVVVFS
jgi:hypothetical protein